jgi:predicted CXXCH cytochrome family protein
VSNLLNKKDGGRTSDWIEPRSSAVRAPRDANQPSVKSRSFSPPQLSKESVMKALAIAVALLFVGTNVANAQFTGSGHDFSDGVTHTTDSTYTADALEGVWNSGADKCNVCHEAHTPGLTNPLWHRNMGVSATFLVYGDPSLPSATLDATVGQPDGESLLCLTCHDGVAGLDQYGWVGGPDGGTFSVPAGATSGFVPPHPFEGDLAADHPVSFVYDDALAGIDGFLFLPSTDVVPTQTAFNGFVQDGTIGDVLLGVGGKLQCTSCHDVHNKWTNEHLLNVPYASSALCTTCHNK